MTNENQNRAPRVAISKRLVMINSASSLVTRMLSISVLVWMQQYLLKRIEPAEYALLPVVYSVMMFAPLVTTILTAGLGRYIVEAYARDDDERVTQIVSTMFPILCGAGLLFLAGGWTLAWHIGSVLDIEPEYLWDARVMMALLMFSAAVRLPVSPFGTGLFVRQKFVLQNIIHVGTEIFRLSLLFTLLLGISTRVLWVITAAVSAEMIGLIIRTSVSRRLVSALRFRPSHIHWPIARELTSFGGWNFLAGVAGTIRTSADPIILNLFATPLSVTCFHLGSMPLRQLEGVFSALRQPLNPALTAMHATRQKAALANVYLRGGRIALWASLFFAVPAMIYSKELITLYVGEKFLAAATVMTLLLAIFPIAYGNTMLVQIVRATAMMKPYVIRVVIMHSLNLVLTICFVAVLGLGAVGSALSTLVAMGLCHPFLMWPLGRRVTGVSLNKWLEETIIPGFGPAFAGFLIWVGLKFAMQPTTWVSLGICASCGCLIYIASLFLFFLKQADRMDLGRIFQTVRRKLGTFRNSDGSAHEVADSP